MSRSGFTSSTVRMTSSNWVTSPRTTGAPIGTPANVAAPGFRSMPITFSPRATRRRMTRGPMKPVAPITSTDMTLLLLGRLPGDHAPVRASLRVDGQIADGEAVLLAVALDVHVRDAVDDADATDDTRAPVAWRDAPVMRLASAKVRDVLGLRLLPSGGVHVDQIVGERGVERGPVPRLHRLEAAVVGAEHIGLYPGRLSRGRHLQSPCLEPRLGRRESPTACSAHHYAPAATGERLAPERHAGITCLPNISMDCIARSCGIVSVCVIRMT